MTVLLMEIDMRKVILLMLLAPLLGVAQETRRADPWPPFVFFVGSWKGTGKGQPGVSKVERRYQFILDGKFMEVKHKSVYEPQPKNPKGETHEDLGFVSYDRGRKQHLFRQFHTEGFVIHYLVESISTDNKVIVFQSESIENIPSGWRARELTGFSTRMSLWKLSNWLSQAKSLRFILRTTSSVRNSPNQN